MNEATQESQPSNRDPLHMYCIVLGMYTHMLCLVPAKLVIKGNKVQSVRHNS